MDMGKVAAASRGELEELRLRAKAERERRVREGGGRKARAHVEYQGRLLDWVVDKLEVPEETIRWSLSPEYEGHDWDGTPDPIAMIFDEVSEWRDVGVESGTGTGKTFGLACLSLAFLAVYPGSLVVTSAPKKEQLLSHMWKEIGELMPRFNRWFPEAELQTGLLSMEPEVESKRAWSIQAFSAGVGKDEDSATKAQGHHREFMLIVTEETPGMKRPVMTAFQETRTWDTNVQVSVGNPDSIFDELRRFCERPSVTAVRASALDHPNVVTGRPVVPGAIGLRRLEERTLDLGRGTPLYESRVRGVSPKQSTSSLIQWEWLEMAARLFERLWSSEEGELALGVDVADSEHGDEASMAWMKGVCLFRVDTFKVGLGYDVRDATVLGDRVAREILSTSVGLKEERVCVDAVGVGAATVNELRRQGLDGVYAFKGSHRWKGGVDRDVLWSAERLGDGGMSEPGGPKVVQAEEYANKRAAAWWKFREDVRLGRLAVKYDERLFRELSSVELVGRDPIKVEPKEELVERLGQSPDRGDSAVLANWIRARRLKSRQVVEQVKASRNVDTGLEKLLARRERERKVGKTGMMKAFGLKPSRTR